MRIKTLTYLFLVLLYGSICNSCLNPFMQQILEPKTIAFETNGGSRIDNQVLYKNEKIKRPSNPSRSGYAFDAWYIDSETFDQQWNFNDIPTGDMTLYAKWKTTYIPEPNTYTVTFDADGGTEVASIFNVIHGMPINAPTSPTKNNVYQCKFDGWYTMSNNKWNFTSDTVLSDITLFAKWIAYELGDTGPVGGKIFYRNENGFTFYQTADDTVGITAYYLEAAPANIETTLQWSTTLSTNISGTGMAIGTGKRNTALIVQSIGSNAPAANACAELNIEGITDWFLPSKDELNELYKQKDICGISSDTYWSSSQYDSNPTYAWDQKFNNGTTDGYKINYCSVRAVRTF